MSQEIRLPKCKHNVSADDGRFNGAWFAPFSNCACCGVHFPYVDSCSGDSNGISKSTTWTPKNLCGACGGKYEDWERED